MKFDIVIIGGGAAGFYTAIHVAEANPDLRVAILERGKEVLSKVKISGGGRCNVTHAVFDPKELTSSYPRGEKELLGPFHTYASGDTVAFFEERGIALKIEEDGRMFPETDSSQTIIDCFTAETERLGIKVFTKSAVTNIFKETIDTEDYWQIKTSDENISYCTKYIVMATGSNPKIWNLLSKLGHTITPPVPSLFTFNIKDDRIKDIPGLSTEATITVLQDRKSAKRNSASEGNLFSEGPLLITHWGMSGPAILKLSAWGARVFQECKYQFKIKINWLPEHTKETLLEFFLASKDTEKKTVLNTRVLAIPKRLWERLVSASSIENTTTWAEVTKKQLDKLATQITEGVFQVDGKSTFKEEFVTAGGVQLKELHFKTYESRILPNLYFAGEILNIDAVTGGFNFQSAWTGGYMAAQGITNNITENKLKTVS